MPLVAFCLLVPFSHAAHQETVSRAFLWLAAFCSVLVNVFLGAPLCLRYRILPLCGVGSLLSFNLFSPCVDFFNMRKHTAVNMSYRSLQSRKFKDTSSFVFKAHLYSRFSASWPMPLLLSSLLLLLFFSRSHVSLCLRTLKDIYTLLMLHTVECSLVFCMSICMCMYVVALFH